MSFIEFRDVSKIYQMGEITIKAVDEMSFEEEFDGKLENMQNDIDIRNLKMSMEKEIAEIKPIQVAAI